MKFKMLMLMMALLPLGCFAAGRNPLRFGSDGKFKIVQFTDVHWQPGNPASDDAARCMNAVLDAERPDLVIYTGDLAYAAPAREAVLKTVAPAVERGIPFAVTWGNHDDEFDASREELFTVVENLPGNMTDTVAGLSGVTNYILPLLASGSDSTAAVLCVVATVIPLFRRPRVMPESSRTRSTGTGRTAAVLPQPTAAFRCRP